MNSVDNFNSVDNLREVDWVQQQTQEALKSLKSDVNESDKKFYEKKGDGSVEYNMDVVKNYLNSIKDKSWSELQSNNAGAWIMAVQIALEKMGYDVGKIDGVFANSGSKTSLTKSAVQKFQSDHGLKADGQPGSLTINKIIEYLGGEEEKEEGEEEKEEGEEKKDEDLIDENKMYADGSSYVGKVDNKGRKQGHGVLKCKNNGLKSDWEYDGDFKDDKMDGEGEYKWNFGKNSFKGEWKDGEIVKCISYDNTIDIKYDGNGSFIETLNGTKLSLKGLKVPVGEFVSAINRIVQIVKNSKYKLDSFESDSDTLQADYYDKTWDVDLIIGVKYKYGIDCKTLVNWLNEYRKDVDI